MPVRQSNPSGRSAGFIAVPSRPPSEWRQPRLEIGELCARDSSGRRARGSARRRRGSSEACSGDGGVLGVGEETPDTPWSSRGWHSAPARPCEEAPDALEGLAVNGRCRCAAGRDREARARASGAGRAGPCAAGRPRRPPGQEDVEPVHREEHERADADDAEHAPLRVEHRRDEHVDGQAAAAREVSGTTSMVSRRFRPALHRARGHDGRDRAKPLSIGTNARPWRPMPPIVH